MLTTSLNYVGFLFLDFLNLNNNTNSDVKIWGVLARGGELVKI